MKQLKFNPDKDMKELEKYGFKEFKQYNHIYYGKGDLGIRDDGEIVPLIYMEMFDLDIALVDIYDLIKANLLIVEEKNE